MISSMQEIDTVFLFAINCGKIKQPGSHLKLNGRNQVVNFLQLFAAGNKGSVVDHWEKEDYGLRKIHVRKCVYEKLHVCE